MAAYFYWYDPDCLFIFFLPENALKAVEESLAIENITKVGCRVLKHPDACVLCVANDDCSRLPMHDNCRCTREYYSEAFEAA
jgi:hypothetical protein